MLYNYSAGGNIISKYQCIEEFTRKVHALLCFVYTITYNQINYNCPRVLIVYFYRLVIFHTRRRFCDSLSVRVSDSGHPVTYGRYFCTNKPSNKIHPCISVGSTWNYTLLNNPMILHTKTFFMSACHPIQIYCCMSARSTRHHMLLYNPTFLHPKSFFAPACHPRKKILSTSKYVSNTH